MLRKFMCFSTEGVKGGFGMRAFCRMTGWSFLKVSVVGEGVIIFLIVFVGGFFEIRNLRDLCRGGG